MKSNAKPAIEGCRTSIRLWAKKVIGSGFVFGALGVATLIFVTAGEKTWRVSAVRNLKSGPIPPPPTSANLFDGRRRPPLNVEIVLENRRSGEILRQKSLPVPRENRFLEILVEGLRRQAAKDVFTRHLAVVMDFKGGTRFVSRTTAAEGEALVSDELKRAVIESGAWEWFKKFPDELKSVTMIHSQSPNSENPIDDGAEDLLLIRPADLRDYQEFAVWLQSEAKVDIALTAIAAPVCESCQGVIFSAEYILAAPNLMAESTNPNNKAGI